MKTTFITIGRSKDGGLFRFSSNGSVFKRIGYNSDLELFSVCFIDSPNDICYVRRGTRVIAL